MKAIWDLLRLEHGFMYALGVIIGAIISGETSPTILLFGALTAIFCQASAFALNDYFDYEVDIANKRYDRPLVRGELSRSTALIISIILAPLGFIFAYFISLEAFIFAVCVTLIGYLYDMKLKEFGVFANAYIAFTMAAPFIFGGIIANKLTPQIIVLSIIAFISGIAREIMKGIEDVEGDALRNVKSLARVKGVAFAAKISALLFLIAVILSVVPFLFIDEYRFDIKYIVPVILTDIILIKVCLNLIKRYDKSSIRKYRNQTLIALLFGLIGFLIGAID